MIEEIEVKGQGGLPICERIPRIVEAMVLRGYMLGRIELNATWYRQLEAEVGGSCTISIFGKLYDLNLAIGNVPSSFYFNYALGLGEPIVVRSSE